MRKPRGLRASKGYPLGVVDYTLAKRALLRDLRLGLLNRWDVCDAHPELLRAARHVGQPTARRCPICARENLRLVTYVYGDGLKAKNGRAWDLQQALALTAAHRGVCSYVVEVCTSCSWNHLAETFRARTAG